MFYVKERYPMMQRFDDAIPPKEIVLFHKNEKGKRVAITSFSTLIFTHEQVFSGRYTSVSKENRLHAEMLALFPNSKQCSKKLRKAFLDSISKCYEKSEESVLDELLARRQDQGGSGFDGVW